MNSVVFLRKLVKYFKIEGSDEDVKERVKAYSLILNQKEIESGRKYDYEKTFNEILVNRNFQDFPMLADIYKHIKYLPQKQNANAKDETKEVKRRKFSAERFGYTYEFYEVSSDWENVPSLSELREDENIKNLKEVITPD